MEESLVVIAGGTGDLGARIIRELVAMNARVRALVRHETSAEKKQRLQSMGVEVFEANFGDVKSLAQGCEGASVVISALSGLREVIIDTQTHLIQAAVMAKVPRFIPSDFSIDYQKIPEGKNRNLNLRHEFQKTADQADIKVTSILNGAFADMLTGTAPFILFKIKRVLCWGHPDQKMDWTTMDDTARFTAHAALDSKSPRFLKIAGTEASANDLADVMTKLSGQKFKILKPGGLALFGMMIGLTKKLSPGENEIYPAWQGMQYMHNMYEGTVKFDKLDNDRYPMKWTPIETVLSNFAEKK